MKLIALLSLLFLVGCINGSDTSSGAADVTANPVIIDQSTGV